MRVAYANWISGRKGSEREGGVPRRFGVHLSSPIDVNLSESRRWKAERYPVLGLNGVGDHPRQVPEAIDESETRMQRPGILSPLCY